MRVQQRRHAQTNAIGGATTQGSSRFTQNVMRFRGQPYQWGGGHSRRSGVQPVDCSGLVTQAARMSGVRVEGRARDMQRMGQAVSMKNLKPGDLVFKGAPAHHVGIYMGNGQVMHAPRRGHPVQMTSVRGFTSARRIPGLSGGAATPGTPAAQPARQPRIQRESYQPSPARHTTRLNFMDWASQQGG